MKEKVDLSELSKAPANVLYSEDVDELGHDYYMEERNHAELIRVQSGGFIRGFLKFSGCKTVGDYWDWLNTHSLCVRYWDKLPTEAERKEAEWKPYVLIRNKERIRMTEEEFERAKVEYELVEKPVPEAYNLMFLTFWEGKDDWKGVSYKN